MIFCVNEDGSYAGQFKSTGDIPVGCYQVPLSPPNHYFKWNGFKWQLPLTAYLRVEQSAQKQMFISDLVIALDAMQDAITKLGGELPPEIEALMKHRKT